MKIPKLMFPELAVAPPKVVKTPKRRTPRPVAAVKPFTAKPKGPSAGPTGKHQSGWL